VGTWSWEVQGVLQFVDDKTFIDDGNPVAGNWWQARAGVKLSTQPHARRHWTMRAGAVAFQANGSPNWVDEPGEYYGLYVEPGFETDITECLTIGPGLSIMPVLEGADGQFHLVPMLNWHATWWLAPRPRLTAAPCLAPGEIYLGGVATFVPSFGGGFEVGQVFARDRTAVWSFEMEATFQSLSAGDLFAEGDGDFAQVRGGLKTTFCPRDWSHPVARLSATWFRETADTDFVRGPGDFVGMSLGFGWEWDLTTNVTTGPEISASIVTREQSGVYDVIPRLSWHLIWKL
jgi:hypothetical protein